MATWANIYTGSVPGNIDMTVGFGYDNVVRNGNNVTFNFGLSFIQASAYYTYNSVTGWYNGDRKYACISNGGSHTSAGTKYYATVSSGSAGSYYTSEALCWTWTGTVDTNATSVDVTVGVAWNAYTPTAPLASFAMVVPIPEACRISISENSKTHNSITLNYVNTGSVLSRLDMYNGGTFLGTYYSSPFTISGLASNTTYSDLKAYAYSYESGWGPVSNSLSIKTYPAPVTVTGVSVTDLTPFTCTANMSVSSYTNTNATEYSIYDSAGSTLIQGPFSSTLLSRAITSLSPETTYTLKVRVQTKESLVWSSLSSVAFTTPSDQSQGWVRYGSAWHKGKAFIKYNGAWSPAKKTFVKVSGTWRNTTNN